MKRRRVTMKKVISEEERYGKKEGESGEFFKVLFSIVKNLEEDVKKFYEHKNKAAGRRIRKTLQEVRKSCKLWREGIQNNISKM
jgi:hypothetical protein